MVHTQRTIADGGDISSKRARNNPEFRVDGTKSVVCQTMTITDDVLLWTPCFRLFHLQVYCLEFKVHSTKLCCVSGHN